MWENVRHLIVLLTSRCNLRCSYCYLAATPTGQDMHNALIDEVLRRADNRLPLLIQLTGGEPTLVPEKIERVVQQSRAMDKRPQLALQTNATLLTEPLVALFRREQIQIGVSLDGPPAVQEQLRGKVNDTLKGMKLLEDHKVPFRVTTVVSTANVAVLDQLVLLLAGYSQCRGIGLDLLVNKGRGGKKLLLHPSPAQLEIGIAKMVRALRLMNAQRKIPITLREMEHLKQRAGSTFFCHAAAGNSLAVTPAGQLYPCGQTMGDGTFALGTITQPKTSSTLPLTSIKLKSVQCKACLLKNRCPGDCPSRIHYTPGQEPPLSCVLYRTLATCSEESNGITPCSPPL